MANCDKRLSDSTIILTQYKMNTFIFSHKDSGAVITITAEDYSEAKSILLHMVKEYFRWRVNNEEGE